MADNGTAAVQPGGAGASPAAQPAQSQSQVPIGYSLVSDADLQQYRRHGEQVRGFEPFRQTLEKSGIKSVDDWNRYEPIVKTAQQRKLDAKQFAAMFEQEPAQTGTGGGGSQSIDIEALRKQITEEATNGALDKWAQETHDQARAGDEKMVEAALNKILGEGEHNEVAKERAKWQAVGWLEQNRQTYPAGHRLSGKALMPITQELVDKAAKYFGDLEAKAKGANMADRATAVNAPKKVGSAAGGGTSSPGKPNTVKADEDPDRPGYPSKARIEAAMAARRASRGQ